MPTEPDALTDGPSISPAGARPIAVVAWVCALLAPFALGFGILLGIAGMVAGSAAHLKGDRAGLPAAVVAGITTIVAMTLVFFLKN